MRRGKKLMVAATVLALLIVALATGLALAAPGERGRDGNVGVVSAAAGDRAQDRARVQDPESQTCGGSCDGTCDGTQAGVGMQARAGGASAEFGSGSAYRRGATESVVPRQDSQTQQRSENCDGTCTSTGDEVQIRPRAGNVGADTSGGRGSAGGGGARTRVGGGDGTCDGSGR